MKNLLLSLAIVLSSFSAVLATSNPTEAIKIVESESIEVTVASSTDSEFFLTSSYNADAEILEFSTEKKMSYIQIFNEKGELDFQLPVMSNKVKISKALFDAGNYKLGFILENKRDVKFTNVVVR